MNLENLLRCVRDGVASADELAACRSLVATDPRIPDELRVALFDDDTAGDAAGLLAILGADDLGLAAALQTELDGTERGLELAELELDGIPVAEAVRALGGEIDLAAALELPVVPLGAALAAEAGIVELWAGVAGQIGIGVVPVADAIRAHAGAVDLWPAVARAVAPRPVAANNNRWWLSGLVAAAAAALLVVGWPGDAPEAPLVFAGAGETRIEELVVSDKVTVMQLEGDEGALILWIEDNAPTEVL